MVNKNKILMYVSICREGRSPSAADRRDGLLLPLCTAGRLNKRHRVQRLIAIALIWVAILPYLSCKKGASERGTESKNAKRKKLSIAVFVPGILADSPIYAMMTDGVKYAAEGAKEGGQDVSLTISEAGNNQAEWGPLLTALAAEGKYDAIISSNPSLPSLAQPIIEQFPLQKFIFLDASMRGCESVACVHINQREQSFLAGYAASSMSKTGRIGLIAAQEYPVMNDVILPGYKEGAIAANKDAYIDFRIVGNWYDAVKGAQLAEAMADNNIDVILPIAAGASQGVINTAREKGVKVIWFDNTDFARAADVIACCAALEQERLAEEVTEAFINGTIEWGETEIKGAKDGYVRLVLSDNTNLVNDEVREKVNEEVYRITSGNLSLPQTAP